MSESEQLRQFTSGLALRLRREERRRFWRLVIYMAVLALSLLAMLAHMQHADQVLRGNLVKQCELRNRILDVERHQYQQLITASPPEQRPIWASSLSDLPQPADCQEDFKI